MKRLLAFFLILMFLAGVSIAESSPDRAFTADEQAYDVYLDVSYVHNQSVRYLSEMERLWDLANDLDSVSDADKLWFHAGLVANFGNNDAETLSRLYAYQHLATVKYGYSEIPELYPLFEALLSAGGRKTTDSIWAGLALDIEAQYIVSPDEMKAYMDDAKEGIRNIMSTDRSYPYLQDLQNYYKEASYLLGYISDFKDNYLGLKEMLDTQKKNQSSYSIDFEFIFDPADFNYVMEVRAAETAEKQREVYDRALALENSGDYEDAIDLYWQCSYFLDAYERIDNCHIKIEKAKELEKEEIYQLAIKKENECNYEEAIALLEMILGYKDSQEKYFSCLYHSALILETEGYYQDAINIYNTISNYQDSSDRANACQAWAFVEPYGIKMGTQMTIHDWGVGEVVGIADKIYTGTTTGPKGTKTHQYVQIWVDYPSKGEMWHHIPDHFEYGLKVISPEN